MNSHDRCNVFQEQQEQDVRFTYDPCLPSPSAEPITLDQGCSGQRFKQESVQSDPSGLRVQEFVQDKECRASYQNTSDTITGHSSKPLEVSNRHLGLVGEHMLWDWFQPERNTVWAEAKVNAKLHNLV